MGGMDTFSVKNWQCPSCNFMAKIMFFPVVCACGVEDTEGLGIQKASEHELSRYTTCESCENYKNNRCSKIDLGCSLTFQAYILNPCQTCPLGRWTV